MSLSEVRRLTKIPLALTSALVAPSAVPLEQSLTSVLSDSIQKMAKVFVTRRIPEAALQMLRDAPEVAEVRVNPDNRVLSREGSPVKLVSEHFI